MPANITGPNNSRKRRNNREYGGVCGGSDLNRSSSAPIHQGHAHSIYASSTVIYLSEKTNTRRRKKKTDKLIIIF